ncbi:hypothetical protein OU997_16235 [Pseudomonas sp. SL4(2022)]|uniref:hypothetical protein n=1 Tax=Pseudomonas sp. SL4(2022) TaxID=2994661 RepID=UPI00226F76BB|nr:hypothetical protein [Pseudomonas sp. SL4(2022)]WAC43784.1 hypothetical protein OU997_16235 [Pseudomonas sp. SL4(2022)]
MEVLARTLIIACKYINDRSNSDNDEDVALLETIASELGAASEAEKQCLIQTAKALGDEAWPEELGIL